MEKQDILAKLREHEAALKAQGVSHAALFGSRARGDARPDSDVDLLIYGDPDFRTLGHAMRDLALVLDRRLDVKTYDRARFVRDNRIGVSFLPAALAGPKLWLIGSQRYLPVEERQAA